MHINQDDLPLAEFCTLVDLPVRTVRFYVQKGLLDRPVGETRAARYGARHVEQALLIKKWAGAGLSLDRIRALLQGEPLSLPVPPKQPGEVTVVSHIHIAEGVEVVVAPSKSGLSPEQLRLFTRGVMALFESVSGAEDVQLHQGEEK